MSHLFCLARCQMTSICLSVTGIRGAVAMLGDNSRGDQGRGRDCLLKDWGRVSAEGSLLSSLEPEQVTSSKQFSASSSTLSFRSS